MQKLLNVKDVKLQCYGKDVKQNFKVFPPKNNENLKKHWNNYEHRTVNFFMSSCLSRPDWQLEKVQLGKVH